MAVISLIAAAWQSVMVVRSSRKQTDVLVKATVTATDEDFLTAVENLREYRAAAVASLRQIVEDPNTMRRQRGNAALALAAFGDSVNTARPILALAEDPSGRTKFIHGYPRFHGDLTEAARTLQTAKADPDAADFRSGLCAALGLIPLPNGWGLFDLHGNVSEWCHDGIARYEDSPSSDPTGSGEATSPVYDPSGNRTIARRVYRGGNWERGAESCRSARRFADTPDSRSNNLGFRVAGVPPGTGRRPNSREPAEPGAQAGGDVRSGAEPLPPMPQRKAELAR